MLSASAPYSAQHFPKPPEAQACSLFRIFHSRVKLARSAWEMSGTTPALGLMRGGFVPTIIQGSRTTRPGLEDLPASPCMTRRCSLEGKVLSKRQLRWLKGVQGATNPVRCADPAGNGKTMLPERLIAERASNYPHPAW